MVESLEHIYNGNKDAIDEAGFAKVRVRDWSRLWAINWADLCLQDAPRRRDRYHYAVRRNEKEICPAGCAEFSMVAGKKISPVVGRHFFQKSNTEEKGFDPRMIEKYFDAWVNYSTSVDLEYHTFPATPGPNVLVDSGPKLKQRGPEEGLPGITSPHWYLAVLMNTVATMHIEDAGLWSVNLVVCGAPKLWLVIPPAQKKKLEAALCREYESPPTCSQKIRHFNVLVSPAKLRDWGITYHVEACHAGEMIFTTPDSYHRELFGPVGKFRDLLLRGHA